MLCPAGLENGLLDPLHVDVEAALLKRARERVRGKRLKPREQGEVAVVEFALRKDLREQQATKAKRKQLSEDVFEEQATKSKRKYLAQDVCELY